MLESVREATTQPDSFFEARVSDPALLRPTVIVTVYTGLTLAGQFLYDSIFFSGSKLVVGLIAIVLGGFLSWLLYAAVFQFISYFFGGEGSFRRTVTLVGWGFLPLILWRVVWVVATIIVLQNTPPPASFQST